MQIFSFETVSSTQDIARRYLLEGQVLPFAIRADNQTKGRGRSGNTWVSQSGNLLASIVLPANGVALKDAGQYSFLTAVALMETFLAVGVETARHKWPNDILVDGKKIAGILLESHTDAQGNLLAFIIGVGVNIVRAPEGAISLFECVLKSSSCDDAVSLLDKFLHKILFYLDILKQEGFSSIREKWLERAGGIGTTIRVRLPNETFYGVFDGIDENGALLVRVDEKPRKVYSGDVFFEQK